VFIANVNNTSDKQLSPVSLLPTINIASVFSLTWIFIDFEDTGNEFITGNNSTGNN
jgi:hypothetical protein